MAQGLEGSCAVPTADVGAIEAQMPSHGTQGDPLAARDARVQDRLFILVPAPAGAVVHAPVVDFAGGGQVASCFQRWCPPLAHGCC